MANVDEIISAAPTLGNVHSITERLKAEVSIGSEFTFGIGGKNIDLSMEDLEINGVPEEIKTLIETHVNALHNIINKMLGWYCNLESKVGKWGNFSPYILTIGSKSLRRPICWIRYDVDPNCMELQMQPITFNEYFQNKEFLQNIVFKIASKNGFTPIPDITGGGGHISFSRSMFDNDVETLIKFIILYSLEVREGRLDEFENLRKCKDDENAPILTREQMQVFKNPAIVTSMDKFVQFMNENIYIQLNEDVIDQYIRIEQKKSKRVRPEAIISDLGRHYQAINLEHMNERDERLRRIEMRRFDAQKDIYEFLRQVESLYKLYAAAKIIPIADVLALI